MNAHKKTRDGNAEEIEKQAAAWIDRRDRAGWSADDQAQLDDWLSQSLSHGIAFWRLNAAWKRTERLAALRPDVNCAANTKKGKSSGFSWTRIVAAFVFVGLLSAAAFYAMLPQQKAYSTPLGGRQTITLADGSFIDMNTSSVLHISTNPTERKVWLDKGEAFFRIKHDAGRPFTIIAAGQHIKDLGTAFSVRNDGERIKVSLTEGRALIEAANGRARGVILKPGDVAVATRDSISISRVALPQLNNELGWRRGVLVFYDTPLVEAASQFDRYSEKKIVVVGTATSIKIGGTFPANDPVSFAAIAKRILHVQVNELGTEIVISR